MMSDRRMYSYNINCWTRSLIYMFTYLANVGTYLTDLSEKLDSSHPLISAQSSFPCKVMDMGYESFEEVF